MEIQIKKAIKAGNSSAVILPRSWLNKEVRIELIKKTPDTILLDVINIAKKYIDLSEVIGIYLTGSYARGEEDESSDIDILIITNGVDKELIIEGIYSILIVSSELLKQKLREDLFPIGQMIKEAKPLLNSDYISLLDVNVTEKNVKWYLDTTDDKINLIKKVIAKEKSKDKKYIHDKIAYTLILRIRTLYIIKKLISNQDYSKKDFTKLIKDISKGINVYERYLAVKNNLEEKNGISMEEAERLYEYLVKLLVEVKGFVHKC
jgi:predicted nucleotidyltransferase